MVSTTKQPSKFFWRIAPNTVDLVCCRYYHMSSFGESKTKKLLEESESAEKLVEYNCKQISRIYPGAKRQDSSNLKVSPFLLNFDCGENMQMFLKVMEPWTAGCQIVALNYQVLL